MKIYFARHGESEGNVQRVFWDEPYGNDLTDKGRVQVQVLADSLAEVGLVDLYCSPSLRAKQTAQIVGRRLNLVPVIEDALRERDHGILEGEKINPENISLCWQITRQWMEYGNRDVRFKGGESFNDIVARFMPFIDRLRATYRDTEASVLLISHGQTLALMLPGLLTNVDWSYSSTHTCDGSFYIITELRGDEWVCLR